MREKGTDGHSEEKCVLAERGKIQLGTCPLGFVVSSEEQTLSSSSKTLEMKMFLLDEAEAVERFKFYDISY